MAKVRVFYWRNHRTDPDKFANTNDPGRRDTAEVEVSLPLTNAALIDAIKTTTGDTVKSIDTFEVVT